MEKKNIKVSEIVYDYLSSQGSTGESFDDVLKRLLGLNPTINDLIAYLPDEIRDYGRKVVGKILAISDDIETKVESECSLIFQVKGLPIAKIKYEKDNFIIRYRDERGEMSYLSSVSGEKDYQDTLKKINHLIRGSYRRWGRRIEKEVRV